MEGPISEQPMPSAQNEAKSQSPHSLIESDPGKNTPFACNICKRSYSRVDHLARHYRSHTREKPFVCNVCNKAFARADLLKRHATSHGDRKGLRRFDTSPQSARVAQACLACASAKLKCGHQKPCHRCQQKGITCTFAPQGDKMKSYPEKSDAPVTKSADGVLDVDGLECAATLSSMDPGLAPPFHGMQFQDPNMKSPSDVTFLKDRAAPTPMATTPASMGNVNSTPLPDEPMMDFDESSLAEFLKDVMMPVPPNHQESMATPHPVEYPPQNAFYGRDVLNFGMESSLDFNDMDFGWFNNQPAQQHVWDLNVPPVVHNQERFAQGQMTPDVSSGVPAGPEAFQKSIWRWKPGQKDSKQADQYHLTLPYHDMQKAEAKLPPGLLEEPLQQASRDQILAMLLGTCDPNNVSRVATSFPSTEFLDSLVHLFFRRELSRVDSFIHLPTFKPQSQRPEFNGIIVASGAVLSNNSIVQRLGYAIQDSVRLSVPRICEMDNSTTRELQLVQTLALQLSIGLWSGNNRKMEIAESHSQPLITMLRRAGHFRRRTLPPGPECRDDDETVDSKWRAWVEAESFKRLAFHTLMHDTQGSICLLTRPLISHAEISLELPHSQALWRAQSAREWRDIYLQKMPKISCRLPSLMQCVHDIQPLGEVKDIVDLPFTILAIQHATWSLVSEYRQVQFVLKTQSQERPSNGALISTSWHQELVNLLDHFNLTISSFEGGMPREAFLLHELFMMNLHVTFEELQLFAGKEGNEEAQAVYPRLRQWFDSRRSRQAIFHAGQVLRGAVTSPSGHLQDFHAVVLYHASLCFWVWGLLAMGSSRTPQMGHSRLDPSTNAMDELVWLDSEETPESRRFVAICHGTPMIRGLSLNSGARIDHPKAVMETIITVMGKKCNRGNTVLAPLVENLSTLMRDLGNAARIVGTRNLGDGVGYVEQ